MIILRKPRPETLTLPPTAFTMKLLSLAPSVALLLSGSACADWITIAETRDFTSKTGEVVPYGAGTGLQCIASVRQEILSVFGVSVRVTS